MKRICMALTLAAIVSSAIAGTASFHKTSERTLGCDPRFGAYPELGGDSPGSGGCLFLKGTIDSEMTEQLLAHIKSKRIKKNGSVWLNSPGGDVGEAMKIGRILRAGHIGALIGAKDVCVSACVYIFAGSISRLGMQGNKVGLHRPYLASTNESFDVTRSKFTAMAKASREYFEEMGIPTAFFEKMNSIPPEKVLYFSLDELDVLGLPMWDPVEHDYLYSRLAAYYGISKEAYINREARVESECTQTRLQGQNWYDCRHRIMQ